MDLNKNDVFEQVVMSQAKGKVSKSLQKTFDDIAENAVERRFPNHSKRKEMKEYALVMLHRCWRNFKPYNKVTGERHNPVAYFTQSATGACYNIFGKHKKNLI